MAADEDGKGVERREFLKRAAITGAAVWSVPVISTLSASPAFAQTGSQPVATTTTEPETTTTEPNTTTSTSTSTTSSSTTTTTRPAGFCGHSVGGPDGEGCMGACTGAGCNGNQCNGFGTGDASPCDIGCPQSGNDNPCCNPGLCDSANFHCDPGDVDASYCGPTVGCDGVPFVTAGCS